MRQHLVAGRVVDHELDRRDAGLDRHERRARAVHAARLVEEELGGAGDDGGLRSIRIGTAPVLDQDVDRLALGRDQRVALDEPEVLAAPGEIRDVRRLRVGWRSTGRNGGDRRSQQRERQCRPPHEYVHWTSSGARIPTSTLRPGRHRGIGQTKGPRLQARDRSGRDRSAGTAVTLPRLRAPRPGLTPSSSRSTPTIARTEARGRSTGDRRSARARAGVRTTNSQQERSTCTTTRGNSSAAGASADASSPHAEQAAAVTSRSSRPPSSPTSSRRRPTSGGTSTPVCSVVAGSVTGSGGGSGRRSASSSAPPSPSPRWPRRRSACRCRRPGRRRRRRRGRPRRPSRRAGGGVAPRAARVSLPAAHASGCLCEHARDARLSARRRHRPPPARLRRRRGRDPAPRHHADRAGRRRRHLRPRRRARHLRRHGRAGTPSCARGPAPTSRSTCAPTTCGWRRPASYRVTGRALRAGRTLAVADVSIEAWDEPGRPVAVGRVQYLRTGD